MPEITASSYRSYSRKQGQDTTTEPYNRKQGQLSAGESVEKAVDSCKSYNRKQGQLSAGESVEEAVDLSKPYNRKQGQLSAGESVEEAVDSCKSYNRKQERLSIVKYYGRMRELGCFTLQDVTDMVGDRGAVPYLLNDYQRKGYIDRIHRNLYTVMDTQTGEPVLSRYQIGSRLFPEGYVALRSAFEAWGYAPKAGNEVFVATQTRFTDFRYNGVFYRRVHPKAGADTEWVSGSLVTGLEQTVVDSLHSFEGEAGLEDVVECIIRLPRLDMDKLLDCLERYGNGYLYQKCGYVLEQLQEYVRLPRAFYRECREHCASTVRYMIKGADGLVYHKGWGVYAPAYLGCEAGVNILS